MHTLKLKISDHVFEKFIGLISKFNKDDIEILKDDSLQAMSIDELNNQIDLSEKDFNNNRYKKTETLLEKYL